MNAPFLSTFTLVSEVFVTAGVLIVFYYGYFKNRFLSKLAFSVLAYEVFVNVAYMVARVLTHKETAKPPAFEIALLALHGTLSLIMLFAIIVTFILAHKAYKRKQNFFKKHKLITLITIIIWFISILSGVVVYIMEYVLEI
ncbi:MAG: DUF420 domain-containing protein [Nanoarchaeota archaeon]